MLRVKEKNPRSVCQEREVEKEIEKFSHKKKIKQKIWMEKVVHARKDECIPLDLF